MIWAINQLQGDPKTRGRCPHCDEEFPMANWTLFYGKYFPKHAEEAIEQLRSRPEEIKGQYFDLKRDLTVRTAEISIRVKMGQVLEQIVPALPSFPYRRGDCRSLFKPIDYLVFEGLTSSNVDFIHFIDIKTGRAGMNDHERDVERVIEKQRVEFVRYGAKN